MVLKDDLPLADAQDLKAFVAGAMNAVRGGGMDPKTGNALAVLGGLLLRVIDSADLAADMERFKEELERRKAA